MAGRIVATSLPERGQEGLRDDILGQIRAEAAGDIPADAARVALEQQREPFRLRA